MKKYNIEKIRNIVFVGHQSSGKTSLGEAILFNAGITNRIGRIEDGNTILDSSPDEIERHISISTGVAALEYGGSKINLLDTPGYEDFVGEVLSSIPVSEGAVVLMSADSGVEVGTEKNWKYLDKAKLARIVCVNRMDKEHADFDKCLAEAQRHLGAKVMPVLLPVGEGESFRGVVDILKNKALIYAGSDGKFSLEDVPGDLSGAVDEWRQKLMDFAAESDDSLLEKFLEGGTLSDVELEKGLSAGCLAGTFVPLAVTSATGNIGVPQLMDLMISMLPSPLSVSQIDAVADSGGIEKLAVGPGEPTTAFIFKTLSEKHTGDLSFIRTFSGEVKVGDDLFNSNLDSSERIGQLYFTQGKERKETDSIPAGDIGAAVKLKSSKVNHTLCLKSNKKVISGLEYPQPTLHTAIEAKAKGDMDKVSTGLNRLSEEDPSFKLEVNPEIRQTILSGQGELHLEVILGKLKRKYGVEVDMIPPRIPYRETITVTSEAQGKHKKQSGGRGQYGDVWLRLEPRARGEGFEFVNGIVGGVVPSKYVLAVEKGVVAAMEGGVIAGNPVQDVRVTLYDGSFHTVDSSDAAFKMAGIKGFKAAVKNAKPVILEPIYSVEVLVPEEYMGDVMGDLSMRRGKIQGTEQVGNMQCIKAVVPLAELHRYSTSLRSMTQGKASHRRDFSHYEIVPHDIAQKLIAEAAAEREESS
ncbi:MAG: elongation factor G [Candidatus Krumholzibacteriota bacterium]|nr:elongation factor G [Candidatus Krumholzibacteriota bacterium]